MKKVILALMASLAVFSFIACDNGSGGGNYETTPQVLFTATPSDNGIDVKVSSKLITSSSYYTYRIIRKDEKNNRLEIYGRNTPNKDLQFVDYFVDKGKTYTYELLDGSERAINNQNKKVTVQATNGKGDIKLNKEPNITLANNVLTVVTKPEFNNITGIQHDNVTKALNFQLKTNYQNDTSSINLPIPSENSIDLSTLKSFWNETINSINILCKHDINGVNFEKYFNVLDKPTTIGTPANSIVLSVLDYQDTTSFNYFDDNELIWNRFEKDHPNIKLEREVLFNAPFHEKTATYAATGKMPDVFYMWPAGRSSVIHEKKLAKNLMPFLTKDNLVDKYSDACLDPAQQKSGYVAEIPFGLTSTNCVFANTKILAECGLKPAKTYDELKAQLPVLKAAGKKLIIMANQDDWVMQSCLFSMICGRMAGKSWADDILNGKAKFTDAPFKSAVQMVKTMYDDGVLSQESLATPYGDVPGQFASEQGAYLIDGDWRCGAFLTDYSTGKALISPEKQESDIELIQFPSLPGEKLAGANSGVIGVGYGMSSSIEDNSPKEDAAWELVKWLSGQEVQQRRLDTGASFPSWTENLDYSNCEPISAKRSKWYGTATAVTPVLDSVFSMSVANVANAELQKLGLGYVTVDQVCEAIQAAYEGEQNNY